ncbi:MAG: polymorphic toxin-type HINT domain-containing protein, partial [Pirellulales bacterium]
DSDVRAAQIAALGVAFVAASGAVALSGAALLGVSQVGVVPLTHITTQLGVEYSTFVTGGGVCGAAARALTGNCFVAGTQVIVPSPSPASVPSADGGAANALADQQSETSVLGSFVLIVIGLAGYSVAKRERRGAEKRRWDQAIRSLFDADDDKLGEGDQGDCAMNLDDDRGDYGQFANAVRGHQFHDEAFLDTCTAITESPSAAAAALSGGKPRALGADVLRQRKPITFASSPTQARSHNDVPKRAGAQNIRRRFGTVWLLACLALAAWLGVRPPAAPSRSRNLAAAVSGVRAPSEKHASVAIENIRVGQRVLGENPELGHGEHSTETAVDPATWRLLKLHAEQRYEGGIYEGGITDTIEVETLQPLSWITQYRARQGSSVPLPLDLVEMGMTEDLRAEVISIEPCPDIADGPGHVVTTTINHLNAARWDLAVEDSSGRQQTIKTTAFHKFFTDTRRGWVSASELREGECLRGIHGPLTLATSRHVPGVERVYNFSVESEHVYHVSPLGVLVHNPGCTPTPTSPPAGTTVYRVWGGRSGPDGPYWSTTNPFSVANYRGGMGLPNTNSGQFVSTGTIVNPSGIIPSTATPIPASGIMAARPGGLPQLFIPNPPAQVQVNNVTGGLIPTF